MCVSAVWPDTMEFSGLGGGVLRGGRHFFGFLGGEEWEVAILWVEGDSGEQGERGFCLAWRRGFIFGK